MQLRGPPRSHHNRPFPGSPQHFPATLGFGKSVYQTGLGGHQGKSHAGSPQPPIQTSPRRRPSVVWRHSEAAYKKKGVSGKHPERYPRSGQASLVHDKKQIRTQKGKAFTQSLNRLSSSRPSPARKVDSSTRVFKAPPNLTVRSLHTPNRITQHLPVLAARNRERGSGYCTGRKPG